MQFRTTMQVDKYEWAIAAQSKSMFIGSCFTENIGNQFAKHSLPSMLNPFGIVYNPSSVAESLRILLSGGGIASEQVFFANEQWQSYLFHSRYSANTSAEALSLMRASVEAGRKFLLETDYLFITWGTSYFYTDKQNRTVVANNHKMPASNFERASLSVADIVSDYSLLIGELQAQNPNLKIILTVSPVRHLKDGLHGNQLSKARLLLAAEALECEFACVSYFPAYEIVIDELRDYRFFADDMAHPSSQAVAYVWELFVESMLAGDTKALIKRTSKLHTAMQHRVRNADSEAHQKFRKHYRNEVNNILEAYPFLCLDEALEYFS